MTTKNITTLDLKKSTSRSPWRAGFFLIAVALTWAPLSPTVRAVNPSPDGGYPKDNTAEGDSAPFSLTTRMGNTVSADTIYWTSWSTNTAGSIATPKTAISVT